MPTVSKILLPYQQEIYKGIESHKYSVILAARQTGKSFIVSLWAFFRALELPNHTILVISPSERQSKNLIDKVKLHIQAVQRVKAQIVEDAKLNSLEVRFPNGSRIIALPSKPETVRGFSGDVIMDEAAFFEQGMEVYQAVFPTITRKAHYKLIAISTPKGKSDLFYFLWQTAENNQLWFKYKLTILDAVKKGLNIDIDQLRQGIKNEDAWKTEYMCEFIDEAGAFLPYELIQSCETEGIKVESLKDLEGDVYLGIDIGRKHDLTVISVLEKLGDVLYLRKQEIIKNLPFREQFNIIDHYCNFARRVAIDNTGLGMQLSEELQQKWGEIKVLPITFTAKTKEELATKLKSKFQDKLIRIYPDKDLREDLHSVQKIITPSGNIKLEADRTEKGHADRFWSLALAVYASNEEEPKIYIPPVFTTSNPIGGKDEKRYSEQMDSQYTW